ncbi:glycosyltransferase family 4 protein [Corynebacterium sp. TAE3-ERU12]|uniref:glycosyltransferase family 4 protein n=1 Tax=Corynebacterium sp. TAE3-ERU12 TaxID=2849491 RepID=UPI001C438F3B|nr:glycosyltransferase family 4 protein [Corynebacterium sp. TAE3-ERU12]MBV7296037.1 glycosyltransferase family 4 protein [Corynebacterium sp. TAE3-ERU12]
MKVLLLCWRDTGHPEGGGSERYLEHVAVDLAAAGDTVVYRTAAYPGAPSAATAQGVHFSRAGGRMTVYPRAWLAMIAARFGRGPIGKALGGRPDVVLDTQNGVPFFARIFAGAPTVVLTHHCHREQWPVAGRLTGIIGWFIESRLSPLVHRGCRYITVSQPSAADLRELGVAAADITVIRNGVDTAPAATVGKPTTAAHPEHAAGPRMVTLSRLVPHKQIEHAISALPVLVRSLPEVHLDIIGSGWWGEELRQHAQRVGVLDRVTFHGQVTEARKHELLEAADLHIMPSRKEGWGLAVIEAALHGVPTVGYRSSAGLRDSVVDGETGLLADGPAQLTDHAREILSDPTLRAELGQAAQRRAQTFQWSATTAAVAEVLREAARR